MKNENLMKLYRNGFFYKGHFIENNGNVMSSLEKIKFEDYDISIPKEYIDEFPYVDAWIFLHGSCDLFAYALHQHFGFQIYELKDDDKLIHCYCKLNYCEMEIYVDVRGATTDKKAFFSEFKNGKEEICKDVQCIDINAEFAKEGLEFADKIIMKYRNYYAFD